MKVDASGMDLSRFDRELVAQGAIRSSRVLDLKNRRSSPSAGLFIIELNVILEPRAAAETISRDAGPGIAFAIDWSTPSGSATGDAEGLGAGVEGPFGDVAVR